MGWQFFQRPIYGFAAVFVGVFLLICVLCGPAQAQPAGKKLLTVYDRGVTQSFLTDKTTIGAALDEAGILLDGRDAVEPRKAEELVASQYRVNIYRARPVMVVDGPQRIKVMTPYQTAARIAADAKVQLYDADTAQLSRSTDYVGDGAGLTMTIQRATPFFLDLYGNRTEVRTQAKTLGAMLQEKKIVLGQNGRTSLPLDTTISQGLEVRVWREGRQTITVDQPIAFETERIFDADREIGYKQVQTPGKVGTEAVTYEIEIRDGRELSRVQIASIVTKHPVKQIEIIGIKPGPNALTKSKGAQYFTDSNGVSHRETYYDLPMNVVMNACGQGGYYTIRPGDGAKVDRDGYVLVAANYGNYPRCSIVETSMGPGKVYDTGGFAVRHPHGFDLATDWTNYDGR
jgi:uncharacterized protein YabE (DUF348 family)